MLVISGANVEISCRMIADQMEVHAPNNTNDAVTEIIAVRIMTASLYSSPGFPGATGTSAPGLSKVGGS